MYMKPRLSGLSHGCIATAVLLSAFVAAAKEPSAEQIMQAMPVPRGIGVILDDPKCRLALELARKSEFILYLQYRNAAKAAKAREIIHKAGLYGTRVYVAYGDPKRIHLADKPVLKVTPSKWRRWGMKWAAWDVKPWKGKKARIVIEDGATGRTSHILVDQIELSDKVRKAYAALTRVQFTKQKGKDGITWSITASNTIDGRKLWTHRLPSQPVRWGIAIDRDARIIVTLMSGDVLCFGKKG